MVASSLVFFSKSLILIAAITIEEIEIITEIDVTGTMTAGETTGMSEIDVITVMTEEMTAEMTEEMTAEIIVTEMTEKRKIEIADAMNGVPHRTGALWRLKWLLSSNSPH